jgi:hypothetical protein
MGAILAGDETQTLTDAEFEETIRSASKPVEWDEETGYDDSANYTARLILEMYESYPQTQTLSEERVYLEYPKKWEDPISLNVTIHDVYKALYSDIDMGISGFQWGWAINAARTILGLGPVPNPAILDIEIPA